MIPLKVPCRSDCPHRNAEPNCHSELRPFGWPEYEKAHSELRDEIHRAKSSHVQTAGKRIKTLKRFERQRKQGRRY